MPLARMTPVQRESYNARTLQALQVPHVQQMLQELGPYVAVRDIHGELTLTYRLGGIEYPVAKLEDLDEFTTELGTQRLILGMDRYRNPSFMREHKRTPEDDLPE